MRLVFICLPLGFPAVLQYGTRDPRIACTRRDGLGSLPQFPFSRDYVSDSELHPSPRVTRLPSRSEHAVRAGQRVILGDKPCDTVGCYQILPPHGRNMIVAISSSTPLLEQMRPEEVESSSDYLPALRAGLERLHADDGGIISTFEYITTHE